MKKSKSSLLFCTLLLIGVSLAALPPAMATVGSSDNGILSQEWVFDMYYYTWGWFGSSPAIADLGPLVNSGGGEPDVDLEIVTGSDELWGPSGSAGVWRAFDSSGFLEWQTGTHTDEARSSPVMRSSPATCPPV